MKKINKQYEIIHTGAGVQRGAYWLEAIDSKNNQPVDILYLDVQQVSMQFLKDIEHWYSKYLAADIYGMSGILAFEKVISSKKKLKPDYIVVFEKMETMPLLETRKGAKPSEVLELFLSLLQSLNYLAYKGMRWSYLHPQNIAVRGNAEKGREVYLRNSVHSFLKTGGEHFSKQFSKDKETFLEKLDGLSIQKLVRMFLGLLTDVEEGEELSKVIYRLKDESNLPQKEKREEKSRNILLYVLEKLVLEGYSNKTQMYGAIIEDINTTFGTSYRQILVDSHQNIPMKKEEKVAEMTYTEMQERIWQSREQARNSYFLFLHTESEYFKEYVKRKLSVGDSTFMDLFVKEKADYREEWLAMFERFHIPPAMLDSFKSKADFMRSYREFLLQDIPLTKDNLANKKNMRLVVMASQIFQHNACNSASVFLMYNFEKLSDWMIYTIYYAFYFTTRKQNLIVAFTKNLEDRNLILLQIKKQIMKQERSALISTEMIPHKKLQNLLAELFSREDDLQEFTNFIYEETEGHISSIYERMEGMINDGFLYFEESTGSVQIARNPLEWKKLRKFEQSDVSYQSLSAREKKMVRAMSILFEPKGVGFLAELMEQPHPTVQAILDHLLRLGIVEKTWFLGETVYRIKCLGFRHDLYENRLRTKERMQLQRKIITLLEKYSDKNRALIAKHYEGLGDEASLEEASKIWVEMGERNAYDMDYLGAYQYYQLALDTAINRQRKFEIYVQLFILANYLGYEQECKRITEEVDEILEEQTNATCLARYYGKVVLDLNSVVPEQKKEEYAQKLRLLHEVGRSKLATVYYLLYQSLGHMLNRKYAQVREICFQALDCWERGFEYDDVKALIYRVIALSYIFEGKTIESIHYNELSIPFARLGKDVQGEINANNNIAMAYSHADESANIEIILKMYLRNLETAQKYKIYKSEVLALLNLSISLDNVGRFDEAHKYAQMTFSFADKVTDVGVCVSILGILIVHSYRVGKLTRAYNYYLEAQKYSDHKIYLNTASILYQMSQGLFIHLRDFENVEIAVKKAEEVAESSFGQDAKLTTVSRKCCDFMLYGKGLAQENDGKLFAEINADRTALSELSRKYLVEISFLVYNLGLVDRERAFLESLFALERNNPYMEAVSFFWESILNGKDLTDEAVQKIEEYLVTEKLEDESIQLHVFLAEHFMKTGRIWEATTLIIEAIRLIILVARNSPNDYHRKIFELNYYAKPFYYLEYFKEHGHYKGVSKKPLREVSEEKLMYYLYQLDISEQAERLKVLRNLIRERYRNRTSYHNIAKFLSEFGNSFSQNLKRTLTFIADAFMATEGYLCAKVEDRFEPIMVLRNGTDKKMEKFSRLIKWEERNYFREFDLEGHVFQAVFSTPIYSGNYGSEKKRESISAVLILATEKVVHSFTPQMYREFHDYEIVLSLLIEDYFLKQASSIDRLTKLFTRNYLEKELIRCLIETRSGGNAFSVLMMDLDNFKSVNDTYGHIVGDMILKESAKVIQDTLKQEYPAGRFGGEEFLAVLPNTEKEKAYEYAEKIRTRIEKNEFKDLPDFHITISIGISTMEVRQDTLNDILERSDKALYHAKANGKNQSIVWSSEIEERKPEAELAKGIISGNPVKDVIYRRTFLELLTAASQYQEKEEGIGMLLSRMLEVFDACEVGMITLHERESKKYLLQKGKGISTENSHLDEKILEDIKKHPSGFYRTDWEEKPGRNEITGLIEWSSILGFEVLSGGKAVARVYFKANLREKEFKSQDLKLATIFSNFLSKYL